MLHSESHITIAAVNYARENGIIYLSLPPHTTHRLQPLNVGVFGPLKAKLKTAFNDWHVNNPGKTINIYNIPQLAKIAYFDSFNSKNITSAFTKTAIQQIGFSIASPDVGVQQIIPESFDHDDQYIPHTSMSASPSSLSQKNTHKIEQRKTAW